MLYILSLRLLDSLNSTIKRQYGQDQNQAAALMPVRVPPLFFYLLSAVVSAELHRNGGGDFCAVCSAESAVCGDPHGSTYNRLFDCAHTALERALSIIDGARFFLFRFRDGK